MKNILVSNDDGIDAPGMRILVEQLREKYIVHVVAPRNENSCISNAMSYHNPIFVGKYEVNGKFFGHYVYGTPADSVKVGLKELYKDVQFDYVITGINKGFNTGIDIIYSGTIGAAFEAAIMGIKAVAVSTSAAAIENESLYRSAANFVVDYLPVLDKIDFPKETVININYPDLEYQNIKGYKYTIQGPLRYIDVYEKIKSPERCGYWLKPTELLEGNFENTDFEALNDGYVSVTPIHLDLTNYTFLKELVSLK